VVGGWRWLRDPGRDPQVLLFLGPDPSRTKVQVGAADWPTGGQNLIRLRMRPKDLAGLGLLPADLPKPVQQASQLAIDASVRRRDPLSQLKGFLQWDRSR